MASSSDKACIARQGKAIIHDHERFIDRHRSILLRYLDGTAPESAQDPDAPAYVERVLTAWQERFGMSELADPSPEERTFWFALYQLEELADIPGPEIDAYEKLLMQNLIEVRELLRHRRALPDDRFMATRPDGA